MARTPVTTVALVGVTVALTAACTGLASVSRSQDGAAARPSPDAAVLAAPVVQRAPRTCAETGRALLERSDAGPVPGLPIGPGVRPAPIAARSVYDFVASVGVNIHSSYTDTPYGDHDRLAAALDDLGVRHVRDGIVPERDDDQYPFLRRLAQEGVCTAALAGDAALDPDSIGDTLADLDAVAPAVEIIEGPNEVDLTYGDDWDTALRRYHIAFAEAVRADGWDVPIVGPSFGRPAAPEQLGDLRAGIDLGNIHPYPDGQPPSANLELNLRAARAVTGAAPVIATEHGYHTAADARGAQASVSDQAAAVYVPRVYLESFAAGVARTYLYELIDQFPDPQDVEAESQFGLLRNDWRLKPAAESLRALLDLLGPRAAEPHTTGALPVAIDTDATDVRALLLQDVDARYWLVLWREVEVSGGAPVRMVDVEPVPATVVLDRPAAATVHRLSSTGPAGGTAEPELSGDRVDVAVAAEPVVVAVEVEH